MVNKRIVLKFPTNLVDQPIVYKLVKEYDLVFNIMRARVTPKEKGEMALELTGKRENYEKAVKYLSGIGVAVEPLSKEVTRDDARCTQCGACVTICPAGALYVNRKDMAVIFDPLKCIACELCVKACPPRAMKIRI